MGRCSCNGHSPPSGCPSNTGNVNCYVNTSTPHACHSHTNTTGCHSHSTAAGGCVGHSNSCPSHAGYVGPRTVVFTNVEVTAGEVIDLENEFNELQDEINTELVRRSLPGGPLDVIYSPVSANDIRQLRDLFLTIVGGSAVSPYSDNEIKSEELIEDSTIETMKDMFVANVGTACACDCNYSCTCDCNYSCTCDCNYCTCDCNYCTCDCNYSCTCNCNY